MQGMAVLMIIPTLQSDEQRKVLDGEIRARFGNGCLRLPKGEWLIAYEGTSRQFSDDMDLSDGRLGSVVVVLVGGYWGYSGKEVWEWLSIYMK